MPDGENPAVLGERRGNVALITVDAPLSVQASRRVAYGVDAGIIADEELKWERSTREFTALLKSEDAKEGLRAFAEKRQPAWKAR